MQNLLDLVDVAIVLSTVLGAGLLTVALLRFARA